MKHILRDVHFYFPSLCEEAVDIYENNPFELVLIMADGTRHSYYSLDKSMRKLPKGPELTEEEYRKEFGIRLSDILYRRGISQDELSKMTDISRASINHYVNGLATPSYSNASRIARALHMSLDDFTYVPIDNIVKCPFKYYEELEED